MKQLVISDLHLTSNPRDDYRWDLFPWLLENLPKHDVRELLILGDLCESKDNHSSKLVNRLVDALLNVYRQTKLLGITILRGNHDGLDPATPYFRFLGQYPSIKYIAAPWVDEDNGVVYIPHTKSKEEWKGFNFRGNRVIMMHMTVSGSVGENGVKLDGVPLEEFKGLSGFSIFSGDVHVPQDVGPIKYVGAPYPVKFGDKYTGRALLLNDYEMEASLDIPNIQRLTVTISPADEDIAWPEMFEGDQIKFKIRLAPHEYVDWQRLKDKVVAACEDAKLVLCGIELERVQSETKMLIRPRGAQSLIRKTPQQVFDEYCTANKFIDTHRAVGLDILQET